jgi:hypothetical protein
MKTLLLLLCLAPHDQAAEAKKLLDALAPPVKDSPYSQLSWEVLPGPAKCVGYFKRGKAWRTDNTTPSGSLQITVWNGKELLIDTKTTTRGRIVQRKPEEDPELLTAFGGALAEITYSGNADRLMEGASKVTLVNEQFEGKDCAHVTVFRKEDGFDYEHHVWIDAKKRCVRYARRAKIRGEDTELIFTYKVVQPPTTTEETFSYQPPAQDK